MNNLFDFVDHPQHYGGAANPYEHIKVVEAWGLGYNLGNATKYIARAGKKTPDMLEDLKKARWYLDREIENLETPNLFANVGPEPHVARPTALEKMCDYSKECNHERVAGSYYCAAHQMIIDTIHDEQSKVRPKPAQLVTGPGE